MHTLWSYDSLSPYKASFGTVTANCVWWLACGAPVATIHTIHVQSASRAWKKALDFEHVVSIIHM